MKHTDRKDGAKEKKSGSKNWLAILIPILIVFGLTWGIWKVFQPSNIETSEGMELLRGDTVERVVVNDPAQRVELKLKEDFVHKPTFPGDQKKNHGKEVTFIYSKAQADSLLKEIDKNDPKQGYNVLNPQPSLLGSILQLTIPIILLLGGFYWLTTRVSGGRMMGGFGQSKAKEFNRENPEVTFADVAGEDEAVEELQEIKEFLAHPEKFTAVGAKVPRGVLLYGPPGTGKTLLAKAVAGEANVPFFSMSGSEFMELYVGVGASRVRDLFDKAKKAAPAIIFVDEIDAVGRHRGSGIGGGSDEREQTLNQMLVEMDGFDDRTNVLMIAATNRPDILDPALLRPGRFDRQIAVEAPDMRGRYEILKVHARGKPLTSDVDLKMIAKRTPGFTGADLANVLNEAALLTARSNADLIDNRALDEAIDRVIAGPQKRTRVMNDHDKAVTAYHEGGHALCAAALRYTAPVTKVTILPRGRALGYTMVMPTEDRYSKTRNQLLDDLVYALGGRVAEELIFRDPSTGAANDIEKATATARAMITDYGMSDRLGLVKLGSSDSEPFVGREMGKPSKENSDAVHALIDEEVRHFMDEAMREAWEILSRNRGVLDTLASRLLDEETLNESELQEIFKDVIKQDERPVWNYQSDAAVPNTKWGDPVGLNEGDNPTTPEQPAPMPTDETSRNVDDSGAN